MAMRNDETGHGRRDFLRRAMIGGGALALGGTGLGAIAQLARGQDEAGAEDRFYVFAYFNGGWDTILGIDPRDPGRFDEESIGVTRIQPGYGLQSQARFQEAPQMAPGSGILLGPAARALDGVPDGRLAVVRGMSMDTLTHEVGRRRFLTGKPPSGLQARGSAGSAWLAAQFGGERLIPNLSVRVESFNPELGSEVSALTVGSSTDLVSLLGRSGVQLDSEIDAAITALNDREASCARSLSSPIFRASDSARRRLRGVLDANVKALFDFGVDPATIEDTDLRAKMLTLHERFRIRGTGRSALHERAAIAAQALANGVARVVTFQATDSLDTHFNTWESDQAPRQDQGFEAVTLLAQHLDSIPYGDSGESMLDRTTIVGFSEFMRTPLINAQGGRDHWLTNSCFLVGGRIRPGAVIGASSDIGMQPQAVDLQTGELDPGGEVVRPEHIWRTLLADAGLEDDLADLRVPHIPALLAT